MIFRFGSFELDEEAGELRRDGKPVAVQPKPLALLALLIRERDRLVPADEIFAALWPGVAVTPSSLTRAVSLARRAIGDHHRGELLRSVSRRGYRFCGEVVALDAAARAAGSGARGPEGPAAVAPAGPPFVGRDEALHTLQQAWGRAVDGHGSVLLLSGPAGIGKTRLAEVFAADVERRGGLVLLGRSREGEGVPAFWLWAQVLRRLVERGGNEADLRELGEAAPELAALVPELGGGGAPRAAHAELSREQERFLLLDAVARALAKASRRRPLALVLEDVQWAGPASLRLVEHLAFELADQPIVLLATVRDEPRGREHPLERVLPSLRQQPHVQDMVVAGLSRRDVARLLEIAIGRPAPPDLTSELFARTEGVPLFVREAIRLLTERGDLRHPERIRRWAVTLPARALDLIRRPLDRLPPEAATLVAAAAVLGREFSLGLAAAVADLPREKALDLLDGVERAGVVEASDAPGSWRFAHALFQEAACEALSAAQRARLHARAAAELERRHRDDLDRVIAELAHHHHRALAVGDAELAFDRAWRAARRATRLLAHEQAATHCEQALAALEQAEPLDPERRIQVLLALGEAHAVGGDRRRRREAFAEAMDVAGALGRPVERARAAAGFCDLSEWAPRDDEGRTAVEDALRGLPPEAETERVGLLSRLAYICARELPGPALRVAREAVTRARSLGDPAVVEDAIYALFFLIAGPDGLAERDGLAREVEALVRSAGATDAAVITLLDAACDRMTLGEGGDARRWREAAERAAGASPHPGRLWHLRVHDCGVALTEGRLAEAERDIEETTRLGQRIGHPYARGVDRALRVWLARERGEPEAVIRIFEPTVPIRLGPVQYVQAVVARTLAALGRRDQAQAYLDDLAADGLEGIPRNIRWHATIAETAHLVADLGDAERARAMCEILAPVEGQHGVLPLALFYVGPFSFALARLREMLGDLDEALALYEEALAAAETLAARPSQTRILLAWGDALLRRGQRRAARERFARAAGLAAELGLAHLEEAAQVRIGRCG